MVESLTTNQVWRVVEKHLFAVVGMVNAKHEARTVGIVYAVRNRNLYFVSVRTAWKVRHIAQNPHVSVTIPIAKRVPFFPWVKVPAATITVSGTARILNRNDVPPEIVKKLLRGTIETPDVQSNFAVIEVELHGNFVTYGIGVPLLTMRDTQKARGRVPVA